MAKCDTRSKIQKKYRDEATPEEKIIAVHYPLLHAFLALAMAYHSGVHNRRSADVVEKLLSALYTLGDDYTYIKQNYKELAGALARHAVEHRLSTNKEKTKEVMERAFEKTFKIIDKLLPEVNEENLEVLGRAIHKHTDDPFVVLRNAGIDIEPELEEFRQFLAEISGKKPPTTKREEPEKKVPGEEVIASKLAAWLENQIRALKESSAAKIYGGVPVVELRNLREKILAKKRAMEKAMEIVEKEWMRGNVILREKHMDLKGFYDMQVLAEKVKREKLDPLDVRTILAVEKEVMDRVHEHLERLMGNPENLMENRRAYGVEDKYFVKVEALKKMHEKLKPHFETARVKILEK